MKSLTGWLSNESHRAYLYRIAVVLVPVLVTAGVLTSGVAQTVLTIAAAVLGLGAPAVAAANTSTKKDKP